MKIVIALCPNCNREFRATSERKYCSSVCASAARAKQQAQSDYPPAGGKWPMINPLTNAQFALANGLLLARPYASCINSKLDKRNHVAQIIRTSQPECEAHIQLPIGISTYMVTDAEGAVLNQLLPWAGLALLWLVRQTKGVVKYGQHTNTKNEAVRTVFVLKDNLVIGATAGLYRSLAEANTVYEPLHAEWVGAQANE